MNSKKKNWSMRCCLQNDANFAVLYQLTLNTCGRANYPDNTFSQNGNGWLELAKSWDVLLDGGAVGVFLEAVHRIMWGIPSCDRRAEHEDIVRIVAEELARDGEAFAAWDSCSACDEAIAVVGCDNEPCVESDGDYCVSVEHYHYLRGRMLWSIRYSKAKYAVEGDAYKAALLAYETAIKRIIPGAEEWYADYWCDENHIFDELVRLYGVDYRGIQDDYERILMILTNSEQDANAYALKEAWCASNISTLPLPMARVVWPDITEEKVLQLFLLADEQAKLEADAGCPNEYLKDCYIHPMTYFGYDELRNSWLYTLMSEWADEDWVEPFVKRKVFDLSMTR